MYTNYPQLLIEGKEVTVETKFTAKEKNGFVTLAITFVGAEQQGREVVVFEDLLHEGQVIVTYADIIQVWKKKNKSVHHTRHLDETYIKVKGKWCYLYCGMEQEGVNDD
ncbi:hypothetical protein bthur0007_55360 [Bacillus thuringiensis serovar monterrey BGSC 4AJ1]|nr:hypothetical protein bthur0007_55360 [Bacillus thuringiensis serovar monterrey BGSC 4AJ1]